MSFESELGDFLFKGLPGLLDYPDARMQPQTYTERTKPQPDPEDDFSQAQSFLERHWIWVAAGVGVLIVAGVVISKA